MRCCVRGAAADAGLCRSVRVAVFSWLPAAPCCARACRSLRAAWHAAWHVALRAAAILLSGSGAIASFLLCGRLHGTLPCVQLHSRSRCIPACARINGLDACNRHPRVRPLPPLAHWSHAAWRPLLCHAPCEQSRRGGACRTAIAGGVLVCSGKPVPSVRGDIRLENIVFAYPTRVDQIVRLSPLEYLRVPRSD